MSRFSPRIARDALGALRDAAATGGDVAPFRIGPLRAVVVSAPAPMREVLVERPEDFPKGGRQLAALRPVLGHGLLTSEGALHRRQRRLVQPLLVPARMDEYASVIVDQARAAMDSWPRGELDIGPVVTRLAMDVIGRVLFGRSMDDEGRLAEAIRVAFEWEMRALTSVAPVLSWLPTRSNLIMRRAVATADDRLRELVTMDPGGRSDGPTPLLRRLVDARDGDDQPMTPDQLFDEVRTIWGAAHETSADAQVWCLDLLARHPHIQRRVAEEAAVRSSPASANGLGPTPYALQVFKEAMRLYPPAAVMLRAARRRTRLAGVRLDAGTPVFLSPYLMHRRADLFAEPGAFDPERFAPQREGSIPRHAYLPFGAGRRVCVGAYLALLEGQLLTSLIVERFRLEPVTATAPVEELLINLRPAGPVLLRVTDRSSKKDTAAEPTTGVPV